MTGRVIEDDMLRVCDRLRAIDDGYFVFLNYKTGRLEVHNRKDSPNTLCLVLPYDTLDERTVRRVRCTRAERVREMIARMDAENERKRRDALARAVDKAAAVVG